MATPLPQQGVQAILGGGKLCPPHFRGCRRHCHTPAQPPESCTRSLGPRAGHTKQLQGLAQPAEVLQAYLETEARGGTASCPHTAFYLAGPSPGPIGPSVPENPTAWVVSWSFVLQACLFPCTLGVPMSAKWGGILQLPHTQGLCH